MFVLIVRVNCLLFLAENVLVSVYHYTMHLHCAVIKQIFGQESVYLHSEFSQVECCVNKESA